MFNKKNIEKLVKILKLNSILTGKDALDCDTLGCDKCFFNLGLKDCGYVIISQKFIKLNHNSYKAELKAR